MKRNRLLSEICNQLHIKKKQWKKEKRWFNLLQKPYGKKVYILGSPEYANLGDSAILIAQIRFLEKCGFRRSHIKELTFSEYYRNREEIKKHIKKKHLLCGLGGGNMGNQWPEEEKIRYDILSDFPNNPMIVFPQTIFFLPNSGKEVQQSVQYLNARPKLTLVAREKQSFAIMKDLYSDTKILLTPDIVLSLTKDDYGAVSEERNGVLFCIRSDVEKEIDDTIWVELENIVEGLGKNYCRIDMYSYFLVTKENRLERVREKMQEFCGAELVITDRLHGMIFSALTGTPCIVFSNYNHKIKGTYEWIQYLPYIRYVETAEEAQNVIPELLVMGNCKFDNKPLDPYFEKLAEVVKKYY